jgi:hypothetical protein
LCQRVGGFREKPEADRAEFLRSLGLTARETASVLRAFEALAVINRPYRLPDPLRDIFKCPIAWKPSVLTPVFYGIQEFGTDAGVPAQMRIFWPSLDGSVWAPAPLLVGCGRYPLVLFVHGQCEQDHPHFTKWYLLPAQLARSGYVVVVPEFPSIGAGSNYPWADPNEDLAKAEDVLMWMRSHWDYRDQLAPTTAIVGHSYGALLGSRLAAAGLATAYVSLSGVWDLWQEPPARPVRDLNIPKLFTWGSDSADIIEQPANLGIFWDDIPAPKHKITFQGGYHWDYLPEGQSLCGNDRGPCNLLPSLASDFTALFISKYMAPESAVLSIPGSLEPPQTSLTFEQEFYAGGHLIGLAGLASGSGCSLTHTWNTVNSIGSITLP